MSFILPVLLLASSAPISPTRPNAIEPPPLMAANLTAFEENGIVVVENEKWSILDIDRNGHCASSEIGDDAARVGEDCDNLDCKTTDVDERFRIPSKLRAHDPSAVVIADLAWSQRFAHNEEISDHDRPNSCSVVGLHGVRACVERLKRNSIILDDDMLR